MVTGYGNQKINKGDCRSEGSQPISSERHSVQHLNQ